MLQQPVSALVDGGKIIDPKYLKLYLKFLIEHHTERAIQTLQMEKTG